MVAAPAPRPRDAAAGSLPYPVWVGPGLLADAGPLAAAAVPGAERWVVIADATAASHYAERINDTLARAARPGRPAPLLLAVPPGEAHKTRETWGALTDRMLAARCGRGTAVVALGGGVVGDLAGFVAATYMRGVPFVQLPTTLLAMVDASVGGKVAVDTAAGKNLVGAFHPPSAVVIDPTVLATVPGADVRAGAAEMVKHGVIASAAHFDDTAAFLARAARAAAGADLLAALGADVVAELVAASVAIKARVVAADPREHGLRRVLNFGHTVGHAVELLSGYALRHGEAVAIGMTVEAAAAERAGIAAPGTAVAIEQALAAGGLPVAVPDGIAPEAVLDAARLDKKNRAGAIEYALPTAIGTMAEAGGRWAVPVPDALVLDVLRERRGTPAPAHAAPSAYAGAGTV